MKSPVVWMGLFLLFSTLFFVERQKKMELEKRVPVASTPGEGTQQEIFFQEVKPSASEIEKLQRLYQVFLNEKHFQSKIDGIQLKKKPAAIAVSFFGEDAYEEGVISLRDGILPILDRIAEMIRSELKNGVHIEINGYAGQNARERKSGDYGDSAYEFSFARSEWIGRYLERKWRIPLKGTFSMTGMGAHPNGKKVELIFRYSTHGESVL